VIFNFNFFFCDRKKNLVFWFYFLVFWFYFLVFWFFGFLVLYLSICKAICRDVCICRSILFLVYPNLSATLPIFLVCLVCLFDGDHSICMLQTLSIHHLFCTVFFHKRRRHFFLPTTGLVFLYLLYGKTPASPKTLLFFFVCIVLFFFE